MAYWWVNHKQTRDHEVRGDYLWSPKLNQNGARNQSYDNMARARAGDTIFSYANGTIGAVDVVAGDVTTAPKPLEFGRTGIYWSNEGWFLPVAFQNAKRAIQPRDHLDVIAQRLPEKYSPIQRNGNGNQSIYLAQISDDLGRTLLGLVDMVGKLPVVDAIAETPAAYELEDIDRLQSESELTETQRVQLIQARIGQGIFRAQVLLRHPICRVTGVGDKRLLRASHIKPWRESNNGERLNGANGLMLSPHFDALFDLGLMSFEDNGTMLIRNDVAKDVIERWAIPRSREPKPFDLSQRPYLALHRERLDAIGAFRH